MNRRTTQFVDDDSYRSSAEDESDFDSNYSRDDYRPRKSYKRSKHRGYTDYDDGDNIYGKDYNKKRKNSKSKRSSDYTHFYIPMKYPSSNKNYDEPTYQKQRKQEYYQTSYVDDDYSKYNYNYGGYQSRSHFTPTLSNSLLLNAPSYTQHSSQTHRSVPSMPQYSQSSRYPAYQHNMVYPSTSNQHDYFPQNQHNNRSPLHQYYQTDDPYMRYGTQYGY